MNICLVVHQFLPRFVSGTELYVFRLARELIARGHEVVVFAGEPCLDELPRYREWREEVEGIPVQYISATPPLQPNRVLAEYCNTLFAKRFGEFLDRRDFDLVHFCHLKLLGVTLLEEAWVRGIPSLLHLFDFWSVCPGVILLDSDQALCRGPGTVSGCVTCLAADSPSGYDRLVPRSGDGTRLMDSLEGLEPPDVRGFNIDSTASRLAAARARPDFVRRTLSLAQLALSPSSCVKAALVRNGFDPDWIRICGQPVPDELQPVERPPDRELFHFGYLGSLVPHKGPDVLLEAFRRLDWPSATLDIHGNPDVDGTFARGLRGAAARDPRIRFRGPYGHAELARVLSEIDVLVVPSIWYENTPFVVQEALATGTPVLASRIEGMMDIVEEGRNGLYFRRGDARDLLDRMEEFREDPDLAGRLRAGIDPTLRMSAHLEELLTTYEELRAGALI